MPTTQKQSPTNQTQAPATQSNFHSLIKQSKAKEKNYKATIVFVIYYRL